MGNDTSKRITPDDPDYILHLLFCVEDEPKYSQVLGKNLAAFVKKYPGNVKDEILEEFVMMSSSDNAVRIKEKRKTFEEIKKKKWADLLKDTKNPGMKTWWLNPDESSPWKGFEYYKSKSKSKKDQDFKIKVDELLKPFVFFQEPGTKSNILKKYSIFVAKATKTLGIVELGLIAIALSKKIRVSEQNDDGDYTDVDLNLQDLNLYRTNQNRGGGSG